MQIVVHPEPAPDERKALLRVVEALDRSSTAPAPYLSPWRRAALTEDGPDGPYATAPRRNRPGAARA